MSTPCVSSHARQDGPILQRFSRTFCTHKASRLCVSSCAVLTRQIERTSIRSPSKCRDRASPPCAFSGAPSCGSPCGKSCHTSCTDNCALLELFGSSFAFSWCCPAGWRRDRRERWRGPSQPWDCSHTVQEEAPEGSKVPQGAPGVGSTGTGHNRGTALHAPSFHVSRSLNSRRRVGSKGWVVQATLGEAGKTGSWTAPLAWRGPWKGSCCLGLGSCCL